MLRIFRNREAAVEALSPDIAGALSLREREGWVWASSALEFAAIDHISAMAMTERTAQRDLAVFISLGFLEKVGAGRSTTYRVR